MEDTAAEGRREEAAESARRPPTAAEEEDEDEEALHVAKRRKVLCSEFAAITSSDAAVARSFLVGSGWHMEQLWQNRELRACERNSPADTTVGEEEGAEGAPDTEPEIPLQAVVKTMVRQAVLLQPVEDHGGAEICLQPRKDPTLQQVDAQKSLIDLTEDATTSNASDNGADSREKEDDSNVSLITWNIDGLDLGNVEERAKGVFAYLALYNPDIVFLQEVIPPHLCLLKMKASSYTIIPGNIDGYFTVIMLKKSRVKLLKHEIIPFPTTTMKRNLLVVHVSISGNELCLMTSHLESTKKHSKERIKQLKIVLNKIQKESESTTVIFGGDTNLRDSEVAKLGDLPKNVTDIWEFLGKPQHCRYTWDTQSNTNLNAEYKCKMRFDRVYFRPAAQGTHIIPRSMDLIGLEKLDCHRFPSDHWGILCNFDLIL
ncbi:Tyrosyl-DNA phosphodiesterase 2 [Willisornis vidua]|uniref:Tyrosyl-DNA phosphodiesterase 2 n=1 Tax=Willisornis vidua TaxID=1566151 RepID=A0ABQ9DEX6_9PASS|nr:Tyrosyl-DNA phosphodiesterase 2 [Willisornis vidua]